MDRREFMTAAALGGIGLTEVGACATSAPATVPESARQAGLAILPGQWRPYFPFEQIAWVRTPWSDVLFPEYVWLDFPEAIFTSAGLLFLSHVNPHIPSRYPRLERTPWQSTETGLRYERTLPNGVRFGGSLARRDQNSVEMELFIDNRSNEPMQQITLQTCAFLRNTFEFSAYSQDNKFVHVPGQGWRPFKEALSCTPKGRYRLGWRSGPAVSDKPFMVVQGRNPKRWLAMTWFEDTLSFVGNPAHPCMHADPAFPDLPPGRMHTIGGRLTFFEGTLDELGNALEDR